MGEPLTADIVEEMFADPSPYYVHAYEVPESLKAVGRAFAALLLPDPPLFELHTRDIEILEAAGRRTLPTKPKFILDALARTQPE